MSKRQAEITSRTAQVDEAENGFIVTANYYYTAVRDVHRGMSFLAEAMPERRAQQTSVTVRMTAQDAEEVGLVVCGIMKRTTVELRANEEAVR